MPGLAGVELLSERTNWSRIAASGYRAAAASGGAIRRKRLNSPNRPPVSDAILAENAGPRSRRPAAIVGGSPTGIEGFPRPWRWHRFPRCHAASVVHPPPRRSFHMPLFGAPNTAVSGLTAQSAAFGNISDNVANSRQTTGIQGGGHQLHRLPDHQHRDQQLNVRGQSARRPNTPTPCRVVAVTPEQRSFGDGDLRPGGSFRCPRRPELR